MKYRYGIGFGAALALAVLGLQGCKQEDKHESPAPQAATTTAADSAAAPEPKSTEEAATGEMVEMSAEELIKKSLSENLPQIQLVGMTESDAPGIYQVELNGGEVIHVTADGKHIINGDLLAVQEGAVRNVTEEWRSKKRVAALQSLKDENLVVFQAEGEEKGEVIAFTDTSCGYCQKLHQEIPQLNAMGITVKYAAWPRYGLQSPAGQIMANIWCSKDRNEMMTKAKSRQEVPKPEGECDTSAIQDQIALGQQLGVRGTPAVYLNDGRKVGGYRKAADLAAELNVANK